MLIEPAITLNVADVAPAGTVTLEGTLTTFRLELLSNTVTPAAPAGSVRVTVATSEAPLKIQSDLTVMLFRAGAGGSVAGGGLMVTPEVMLKPEYVAVKVAEVEVLTVPAVTVNVAVVEPAATVTLAGTVTADVLELESATETPPVPAAEVRVTVPVPV